MASVFLSYDRDDAAKARAIAGALEQARHTVWWDFHIKGGAEYSKEIEQALAQADAVVVLWSKQAVESGWAAGCWAIAAAASARPSAIGTPRKRRFENIV